jgi:Ca2+-binding RTX toxin-like protein
VRPVRVNLTALAAVTAAALGLMVVAHDRASGQRVDGDDEANHLRGTRNRDALFGHGGDDVIRALDGSDRLSGGPGPDRLYGGPSYDMVRGDHGRDRLRGDSGADTLDGGQGRDLLMGGPGADSFDTTGTDPDNDIVWGGRGNDFVDVLSRGSDRFHLGRGNDTIVLADDDRRDWVWCGKGHDSASFSGPSDPLDILVGCEDVGPTTGPGD